MLEPRNVTKKSFDKEIHRLAGEDQLHRFGSFLESYDRRLHSYKNDFKNEFGIRTKVIGIENKPFEDISMLQLIHSDNKLLSRILVSLGSMCEELNLLINEGYKNYFITFVFYTEEAGLDAGKLEDVSKIIETLQKLSFFVNRANNVIVLLLKQLCAILGKNLYYGSSATCFPEPLDYLAELLVCLVTLDCVCVGVFQENWTAYCRTVRSMLHNPTKFQFALDQLRSLDKCLSNLQNELLKGTVLQNAIEHCLDDNLMLTMKSCNLDREFSLFTHQIIEELERNNGNISFTQTWLQANALFVFQCNIFGNIDKRLFKRLSEINRKTVACTICGNIVWYPEEFLIKHIPALNKCFDLKIAANNRLMLLAIKNQNLPKESRMLYGQAYMWITEITNLTKKDMSALKLKHLQHACDMLIDGVKLVKKISEIVKWLTNLHAVEGKPMPKSVLLTLCTLIETLKAIQFTFQKNFLSLVYIILLISQHLNYKALTLLINIKRSFTQEKCYKEQELDVLSSLNVAEQALKGPCTSQRLLVARLALSASGLPLENLTEVRSVINRLEVISNLRYLLCRLCNCSFLYWHQVLLPVCFSKFIDSHIDLSRFYLLFSSINDCVSTSGKKVYKTIESYFKTNVITPLSLLVETNLRLQTHLHLQLPSSDPFKNIPPSTFKNVIPAKLNDNYIHIKAEIEHYLSTVFYNLTTVVLHDWRTYGEMRRLALLQYGLNTVDDNLPMQTLEQGLDVLEIMRNIHIFVEKYMYNLNNQIFIEEKSNNKHLNTINISHVANSIRTHGIGIMNTTVNFTYQFLQNKFYIFSQFMFDELIKSRLLKDLRFFTDHKYELNQMYPYERAEKFNFGIKRLGLDSEGNSYLDLFRKLITQIGNAMGYVRMIRSGGRRCLADATCFIPDLKAINDLNQILENENLQESTRQVIGRFKRDINNLVENFEEATEYFKLLIQVFIPVFKNPENMHLRNFHIIVPPLTVNFIEHIFICKERLSKRNKTGATFTDDGFAMGLAYIIELLNQSTELDSLNWFQSVKAKYTDDKRKLEIQKAVASKEDSKLQQTLSLTETRLHTYEKEFNLLFFNFNSARIFFQ